MKKVFVFVMLLSAGIVLSSFLENRKTVDEIPYPAGYRTWVHVKTKLVGPGNPNFRINGGYHHIYANAKAMEGYRSGYFPDGAVLVFDVLDIMEQGGNTQEGNRKRLDVMVKDSLKYPATGGWGYEEFNGDSHTERSLTPAARMQCFNAISKRMIMYLVNSGSKINL